jgi:hypothetical protein
MASAARRFRRAATLANEIKREHVRTQAEPFADVAGEAGTQIAGAGADEHRVNFARFAVCVLQCALRSLRSQRGRVAGKAGVEYVGCQIKNLGYRFQRQVACGDTAVAAKHFFKNGARPRRQPGEWRCFLHCVPAFALGKALGWCGNSKTGNEHSPA